MQDSGPFVWHPCYKPWLLFIFIFLHQAYHWSLGPKSSSRVTSLHKTFSTDQKIIWSYLSLCSSWSRVAFGKMKQHFLFNVILILCIEMLFPPFIRLSCKSLSVNWCFFHRCSDLILYSPWFFINPLMFYIAHSKHVSLWNYIKKVLFSTKKCSPIVRMTLVWYSLEQFFLKV